MFVFILLGVIHCYDKIQQESNIDKQILKVKELEQKIVFKQKFAEIPIIILAINDLNIQGQPYQFEINPKDITQGGFVIKYSKYTDNEIKIKVSWMAIFDPRLEVSYVTQLGNKKQFTVPVSDDGIFYSLIGMSTQQSLQTQLVEVKDKLAHFKIIGDAEMIKLCILSGPKKSINFQRVNFVETEKLKWPKQDKMHLQLVKKALKKPQEDQVQFAGLGGFKVESKNLGLTMRLKDKLIFGVNNSKLKGLYINLLTYTADQSLFIMDKTCVELFKECYFQGEKLQICSQTKGEQPKNKFSFKSYMVPDGKVFELLDGERKAKLEGAMSCSDEIILG